MGANDTRDFSSGNLRTSPCNLCPRLCGAIRAEGQRGVCGADNVVRVARAALHYWEEPPLSGTSGSGAVFFEYCPLRCVYCQNAEIASGEFGVATDLERLSEICLDLQAQGALNVNFVTPTHYSLHIKQAVALAREQGLSVPVVWNTSGYERVATIEALAGTVDVFLADYKYASAELGKRYSHAVDYPDVALRALDAMVELAGEPEFDEHEGQMRMRKGVIVRHLLLPGALENAKSSVALLFNRYGRRVAFSLMNQYTPVIGEALAGEYPELLHRAPESDYEALLDFADELGLEDYYWQDGPTAEESFIPAWDGSGV